MTPGGPVLVIDTATTRAVIALGWPDGTVLERRDWLAGYRHGEELLARIEGLLADRGVARRELGAVVVGLGPGAFTGLRVGIATAKGLAHALSLPIVGVSTGEALLAAAATADVSSDAGGAAVAGLVLLQPAGPSDRVCCRHGEGPRIVAGGTEPDLRPGERLVAVDLDGRAPDEAVRRGAAAQAGLADALLAAGTARLAAGDPDDLATLVPEYVTLPRGVNAPVLGGGVELSGGSSGSAAGGPPSGASAGGRAPGGTRA